MTVANSGETLDESIMVAFSQVGQTLVYMCLGAAVLLGVVVVVRSLASMKKAREAGGKTLFEVLATERQHAEQAEVSSTLARGVVRSVIFGAVAGVTVAVVRRLLR
jgi:hypothetical protein